MLFEIKSVSKQIEFKFDDKSAALFYVEENEQMEEKLNEIKKILEYQLIKIYRIVFCGKKSSN